MLTQSKAFSSFSVDDLEKAKAFYGGTLGLTVAEEAGMGLRLKLSGGTSVFIYPKGPGHEPATFTVLNFPVDDIEDAVTELSEKGVTFEQYTGDIQTDEKGIAASPGGEGPKMAWFKDPAGNVLGLMQEA
jgi:catechol 2,3-dioxygenase-like lactoylglutathione lyase family enzyme